VSFLLLQGLGGEESEYPPGYGEDDEDEEPRAGWLQRWRDARQARREEHERATAQADEERMDALLEKIARSGKASLTDEEHRFMARVSAKYRNRSSQ
jgi:hypothetical protein